MDKCHVFCLIILLALPLAASQPIEAIDAGKANITLVIYGTAAPGQTIFVPGTDSRQSVSYPEGLNLTHDEYGNVVATVSGAYSHTFEVRVDGSRPLIVKDEPFPKLDKEFEEYLGDSDYIITSDPEVFERARDITGGSETLLEAVSDLALWVNDNVEYDRNYGGRLLSSREVLETRRGWCGEFSNLYAALARSLNIPTRIATGLVMSNNEWTRHGWAESYVGGRWVPIDGTYGEVGMLDAYHVKLYAAPTYQYYILPESEERVMVQNYSAEPYVLPMEINASLTKDVLAPREIFYLRAELRNRGDTILMPTYMVQKTVGIETVDRFRKNAIVTPGEVEVIEWKFIAPFGERDNYFVVFKGPMASEILNISVDPNLPIADLELFGINDVFSHTVGDTLFIEFNVRNIGNVPVREVHVVVNTVELGRQEKIIDLEEGEQALMEFSYPAKSGDFNYEITVGTGESTVNYFGTANVDVAEKFEESGSFKAMLEFAGENATLILSLLALLVLIGLVIVFLVPSIHGRKVPFKEEQEWSKLLKLKKKH